MTRRAARPVRRPRVVDNGHASGWLRVFNRARIAGLLLVVLTVGVIFSLVTDDRFALDAGATGDVEVSGLGYTDPVAVTDALGLSTAGSNNIFLLRTGDMLRRLLDLPSVANADVRVVLPHRLIVEIKERSAVLRVVQGGVTYLLDGGGVVLEARPASAPPLADLPLIDDRRVRLGIPFETGTRIDPIEAQAMLQIGALTPALVGSAATELSFGANDTEGFVVTAAPFGWRAVFGFYTPSLRPPTLIAQQVQCLRNLLASGEGQMDTIYLAPEGDRCGTYLPRPS